MVSKNLEGVGELMHVTAVAQNVDECEKSTIQGWQR